MESCAIPGEVPVLRLSPCCSAPGMRLDAAAQLLVSLELVGTQEGHGFHSCFAYRSSQVVGECQYCSSVGKSELERWTHGPNLSNVNYLREWRRWRITHFTGTAGSRDRRCLWSLESACPWHDVIRLASAHPPESTCQTSNKSAQPNQHTARIEGQADRWAACLPESRRATQLADAAQSSCKLRSESFMHGHRAITTKQDGRCVSLVVCSQHQPVARKPRRDLDITTELDSDTGLWGDPEWTTRLEAVE